MIKKFLTSKKGVTLLEGLIALLVLALVATGTFAVLLSTSRKSTGPDIREEMALAVEKVSDLLQGYILVEGAVNSTAYNTFAQDNFCGDSTPLSSGEHQIACLLPPICNRTRSSFSYTVGEGNLYQASSCTNKADPACILKAKDLLSSPENGVKSTYEAKNTYKISFDISCNGFTL